VHTGDTGELTAKLGGDTDPAAQRRQLVTETLPEVKAGVGELPYAVYTVCTVRLG